MEEISLWMVYFVIMLPSFGEALVSIGVIALILWVALWIIMGGAGSKMKPWITKMILPLVVVFLLVGNLIPDTKQMAAIVAGHWAINNEEVRELPDQIGMILDSYISDIQSQSDGE